MKSQHAQNTPAAPQDRNANLDRHIATLIGQRRLWPTENRFFKDVKSNGPVEGQTVLRIGRCGKDTPETFMFTTLRGI